VTRDQARLHQTELWLGWIRLAAIPFAALHVSFGTQYPGDYELLAWLTAGTFALGATVIVVLARLELPPQAQRLLGASVLGFDTVFVSAFVLVHSFESGSPVRQLFFLVVIEAAVRYGLAAPVVLALATGPVLAVNEGLRSDRSGSDYQLDYVTFQVGVELVSGLIVGWLVDRLRGETLRAEARADEAEKLRDELGNRVDLVEAANRCARALGSSLDLRQAFDAFLRELRGLVPFDRVAIILGEGTAMRVIAAAGVGVEAVLPPGSTLPRGALVEQVISSGRTVYRRDMADRRHPEEEDLLAVGLRCRLVAPLLIGSRPTGMLSVLRHEPDSFSPDEVELVTLLGRLVGTAVQNIRAYEAEHQRVEELGRLSSLRADFVSLVSHELRSPMAAVIGASTTLQGRWRELSAEQRASFLALISDETSRLSDLVGDVLDTSRIEAGTFGYVFREVSIGQLVRDTVAAASVAQDEVRVEGRVREPLPAVRGDAERLRQVLANLVENAVKYSTAGSVVRVEAAPDDGRICVRVSDDGPGIAPADQDVIFEKFGRAHGGQAKPGTGLGLFIARAIAEAHGGALGVESEPGRGAAFTLQLPL